MSRFYRQGNRSAPRSEWKPKSKIDDGSSNTAGKPDSKIKHMDPDPQTDCLLKTKIDDGSSNTAPGKPDSKIKHMDPDPRTDCLLKTKIEGSLDSTSCSKNDKSSVPEEFIFDDVAFDVNNLKQTLSALDDYDSSEKVNQFGDQSQKDDDSERSKHPVFDICRPKSSSSVPKLKPPLHVMNREKRNQIKQSMKGENIKILGPGMVLMKGYISTDDQISIVKTCRDFGIGDGGFYQPGYISGTKLHLQMMCLGKNWDPDSHMYTELRSYDNSKPPGIPEKFSDMVKKAIQDSNEFIRGRSGSSDEGKVVPSMSPDICIVNFYKESGRLGLHQDKDESEKSLKKGLPVVSFSIGDSAEFLYGETRAVDEADKVILESGDVLIFGGKSRLIFHGVTSIHRETAPRSLIEATNMCPGRLNLTFRMY